MRTSRASLDPRSSGVMLTFLRPATLLFALPTKFGELSPRFQPGKVRRDALLTADSRDILGRRVIKPRVREEEYLSVVAVVRMPGRTNAASARDFRNRSSWQSPRRRSDLPPSSSVQIPRAAVRLPLRVTAPFLFEQAAFFIESVRLRLLI